MALGHEPSKGAPSKGKATASVPGVATDGPPRELVRSPGARAARPGRGVQYREALLHSGLFPIATSGPPRELVEATGARVARPGAAVHLKEALLHSGQTAGAQLPVIVKARGSRASRPGRATVYDGALQAFSVLMVPQLLETRRAIGARASRPGRTERVSPRLIDWAKRYHTCRGQYRVFNSAAYRFYRSNSAPPAETDSPYATSASLPATPSDTFADGTWWISVSYFNGVIDSGFLPLGPNGETYRRIDISGGAVAESPPDGPTDWQLEVRSGGVVRVLAFYAQSDSNRADTWAIAYTTDGSTPATDSPDVTQSIASAGIAILSYDLPAASDGATVKVRLQTLRGSTYSEGSTVKSATADAAGPAAPDMLDAWPGRLPEDA